MEDALSLPDISVTQDPSRLRIPVLDSGEKTGSKFKIKGGRKDSFHTLSTVDDLLKSKPNFPESAPVVFRNPSNNIITSKQLEGLEFEAIAKAIKSIGITITPPRLFIRQVAYRYVSADDPAAAAATSYISYQEKTNASAMDVPEEGNRRIKVFDIRTEVTQFLETDHLIYNPEAFIQFHQDQRHKHKSLSMYKFVASSKLKSICSAVKQRFAARYDHYDVRIINDDFELKMPKKYTGLFYGSSCDQTLRLGVCIVMPLIIPLVVLEKLNRKQYDVGFVFRIKKRGIEGIEQELVTTAQQVMAKDASLSAKSQSQTISGKKVIRSLETTEEADESTE